MVGVGGWNEWVGGVVGMGRWLVGWGGYSVLVTLILNQVYVIIFVYYN